jgi:hypothetical protein
MKTQQEVNQLEQAEIDAWRKYKLAVDQSSRLSKEWFEAEAAWKLARHQLRLELSAPSPLETPGIVASCAASADQKSDGGTI